MLANCRKAWLGDIMNLQLTNVPALLDAAGNVTKALGGAMMTKSITLTRGKVALVDDADYERINKHKWYINENGYAVRTQWMPPKKIRMHREVMKTPDEMITDHINGDKLDNRKSNLRICNDSQNAANGRIRNTNTSGYKGVSWHKQNKKWRAYIVISGKQKSLGLYDTPREAAKAYNDAAQEIFGVFAKINKL